MNARPARAAPAEQPVGLTREQRTAAVVASALALRIGAGPKFPTLITMCVGAFCAYAAQTLAGLDPAGSLQTGLGGAIVVAFLILVGGVGVADVIAIAALVAAFTVPDAATYHGEALRAVCRAQRKATPKPPKKDWLGRLARKVTGTMDEFFAGMQDRAANVTVFEMKVCCVLKIEPPGSEAVWVVGAFGQWYNANVLAISMDRWFVDFAAAHRAAGGGGGAGRLLVRVPPNAEPGQRLSVATPGGGRVEFTVPQGAVPGSAIVVSYRDS